MNYSTLNAKTIALWIGIARTIQECKSAEFNGPPEPIRTKDMARCIPRAGLKKQNMAQSKFEIVVTDRYKYPKLGTFATLTDSGRFIQRYFRMAHISWGPGEYNIYFDGSVSSIVEQTISRIIQKKFGTKLIRQCFSPRGGILR